MLRTREGITPGSLPVQADHTAVRRYADWLRATSGHGIWIAIWSVIGWSGTALAAAMTDQPLLLMLMAPRMLFVALAADSISIWPFVLLGTLRLGVTDASYFILGRRFPRIRDRVRHRAEDRVLDRGACLTRAIPGRVRSVVVLWTDSLCRWLCRDWLKAGTVLFLRPNGKYLAIAGAYGVSARVAALSSVVGTIVYLGAIHLGIGLVF